MRKSILTVILISVSITSFSQKEDYVWRLGLRQGIDFNSGQADTFSTSAGFLIETNAAICSSNGDLLFFTNGVTVFNANSDTMMNGDNLNPGAFTSSYDPLVVTQADIIIQRPEHLNEYYLFHQTLDNFTSFQTNTLFLTVIDMSLDSGRGAVTSIKNYHFYDNDTLISGKLSAVKHGNGRDWWLVTRKKNIPVFYKWLIKPDTIFGPAVQFNLVGGPPNMEPSLGQTCFSPDGSKYAAVYQNKHFYLYDFDRCSGVLNNNLNIQFNDSSYFGSGCAFSQSGRFLYVTTQYFIYQYDLSAGNILASQTIVAVYDGFSCPSPPLYTHFNMMRLAPNGKIYISTDNGCNLMHVIEYPDSFGLACNVQQHSFYFSLINANVVSVPNIPDYKLGALDPPCDSINVVPELTNSNLRFEAYPNPTNGTLTLKFYSNIVNQYELSITDISERLLIIKDGRALKGINIKEMDLSKLAKGIYFVSLKSSEINETIRIMIE